MDGKTLNKRWGLRAKHVLYRETGDWYHQLVRFPGALFDKDGYKLFETEGDFKNCAHLKINQDTNTVTVPAGIKAIPGYNPYRYGEDGQPIVLTGSNQDGPPVTVTMISSQARNPSWTRDELILALELYVQFEGNPPGKESPEVIALSRLLNQLTATIGASQNFRNPNGVYMKLMNFRRFDPVYQAQGKSGLTRGNKLEEVVWNEFASDPVRLALTAEAIKANVVNPTRTDAEEEEIVEAEEGRVLTRAHLVRERSRKLVEAKKQEALKAAGRLACEACGFDFETVYGERGGGFIEVHHALPVHQLLPGAKTKLADLRLLCANCHRMVHSRLPWLTIDQLRSCFTGSIVRLGL